MRFKPLATIAAILTAVNAVFFLLAPTISLDLLGGHSDLTGLWIMRLSGACAFGLATMTWLARNNEIGETRRIMSWGNLVSFGLLAGVDLAGLLFRLVNVFGWFIFIDDLVLFGSFVVSVFTSRGQ